jgi:hypothetical protein
VNRDAPRDNVACGDIAIDDNRIRWVHSPTLAGAALPGLNRLMRKGYELDGSRRIRWRGCPRHWSWLQSDGLLGAGAADVGVKRLPQARPAKGERPNWAFRKCKYPVPINTSLEWTD